MCTDNASFNTDEKTLLDVLRTLCWGNGTDKKGSVFKCHHQNSIKSNWLGRTKTSQQLCTALESLSKRGCIFTNDKGSFCLTDCGLRAIRAFPPTPHTSC